MPSDGGGGQVSVLNVFEVSDPAAPGAVDFTHLIDQFKRKRNWDWTVPEAFLALLLMAAMADGTLSIEEQTEIAALARRSRALKNLDAAQLSAANAAVKQKLDSRPEGLREACEILPLDMRLPLFAHCVDIVLADGRLLPPQVHFLNHITELLAIEPAEAARMLEALLIKNRF